MWDKIQDWGIPLLLTGIVTAIGVIIQKIKANKTGMTALLRDRIHENFDKWMEREYAPIYARENLEKLYKAYKTLGGNGCVDDRYEEFRKLSFAKLHRPFL